MNWRAFHLLVFVHFSFLTTCWGQAPISNEVTLKSLPNAYGQIIDPRTDVEQGLVLIFTNHGCLYSQLYSARLNEMQQEFAALGIKLVAIETKIDSFENSSLSLANYLSEVTTSYSYLIDIDNTLARAMGAESSPHAFLLRKQEEAFQIVYEGSIDNNSRNRDRVTRDYLRDAVTQLLAGEEITYSKSKPIGCDISKN